MRLKRIWSGDAARPILSEKLHGADRVIAVSAGVVRSHHARDGGVPVAGCARSDGLTVVGALEAAAGIPWWDALEPVVDG